MYGPVDLDAAREQIIAALGGVLNDSPERAPRSIMALEDMVLRIAEQEGREKVRNVATTIMSATGLDNETKWREVKDWTTNMVLMGAEDSWSGRGNDMRRAFHDGVRDEARRILDYNSMEDYL